METSDYGFFGLDKLPPLSTPRNTLGEMHKLFDYHNGTLTEPMFD